MTKGQEQLLVEDAAYNCFSNKLKSQNLDINKVLVSYRTYLIDNGLLNEDLDLRVLFKSLANKQFDYDSILSIYELNEMDYFNIRWKEIMEECYHKASANKHVYNTSIIEKMVALSDSITSVSKELDMFSLNNLIVNSLPIEYLEHPFTELTLYFSIAETKYLTNLIGSGIQSTPIPDKVDDLKDFNLKPIEVEINAENILSIESEKVELESCAEIIAEHLLEFKSNSQVLFKSSSASRYDFYLAVDQEIRSGYEKARNVISNELFDNDFNLLNSEQIKQVKLIIPFRLRQVE